MRSSAVIGLPDEDLGNACTRSSTSPTRELDVEALRAHLGELLARYKVPRSFELVSEPLRDDAGKVRRSALREERIDRREPALSLRERTFADAVAAHNRGPALFEERDAAEPAWTRALRRASRRITATAAVD